MTPPRDYRVLRDPMFYAFAVPLAAVLVWLVVSAVIEGRA